MKIKMNNNVVYEGCKFQFCEYSKTIRLMPMNYIVSMNSGWVWLIDFDSAMQRLINATGSRLDIELYKKFREHDTKYGQSDAIVEDLNILFGDTEWVWEGHEKQAIPKHEDQYKCIAISTAHLDHHDRMVLENSDKNMIMGRDTGWFVKLYEDEPLSGLSMFTPKFQTLVSDIYAAGYRMIEFDGDAPVLDGYATFDW